MQVLCFGKIGKQGALTMAAKLLSHYYDITNNHQLP
ncbi:unnamed protein product [Brugia pahangi]|uniref:NAD(P)-dependent oxidoreductase n=1 Tax=Brugia pahangi TaxID=6280 RepID=A0A0N4TZU9_BRUPA|nr:unnamed protein product [Brugia pahangi]